MVASGALYGVSSGSGVAPVDEVPSEIRFHRLDSGCRRARSLRAVCPPRFHRAGMGPPELDPLSPWGTDSGRRLGLSGHRARRAAPAGLGGSEVALRSMESLRRPRTGRIEAVVRDPRLRLDWQPCSHPGRCPRALNVAPFFSRVHPDSLPTRVGHPAPSQRGPRIRSAVRVHLVRLLVASVATPPPDKGRSERDEVSPGPFAITEAEVG